MPEYTPIQRRIITILSDSRPHTQKELHGCLNDELGPLSNVQAHIGAIRKKLKPVGQGILCERLNGDAYYRLVRYLANE